MNYHDIVVLLGKVSFPNILFYVGGDMGRLYLQVNCHTGTCNVTGKPMEWKGRKWYLSPHMCKSEIVTTAFKAVITAMEHETREKFLYNGKAIFGPHIDVDKLLEVCEHEDTRLV